MKLTYIHHSGFILETESATIIFDYWKDPQQVVEKALNRKGLVYVLSSHFHSDHFNPEILTWKEKRPDIRYIFSKDILKHKKAAKDDATYLVKGQSYEDETLYIRAFGSTDSGVSWYIEIDNKRIFHAGDLNNWHWKDECSAEEALGYEKMYLGELKDIKKEIHEVDLAMFPVDKRLGTDYMLGAIQFVNTIEVKAFAPMHFTANPIADAWSFDTIANEKGIAFFRIQGDGDVWQL